VKLLAYVKRFVSQIALEFIIVFSFLLIIFAFLFAVIAVQRAQIMSQQLFDQVQLVAEDIAYQINSALEAGNGYSTTFSVSTGLSTYPIQVYLLRNGEVLVTGTLGRQNIQAVAYASAPIISNSSYLVNPNEYALPMANGTISLQNNNGLICADYSCPSSSPYASKIILSSHIVKAARFNGFGSYAYAPLGTYFGGNNPLTAIAWVYVTRNSDGPIFGVTSCPPGGCWNMPFLSEDGLEVFGWIWGVNGNQPIVYVAPHEGWYMLAITYNPSNSGSETFYVDGVPITTESGQYSPSGSTDYWTTYISGAKPTGVFDYLNGEIANVQAYTINLTPSQILYLYQEGIGGAPIDLQHLALWLPLNGNFNDYSGNGRNAQVNGPIIFLSVAELFAKVTNFLGLPVAGDLVGFASTSGYFAPNTSYFASYTDSQGVATAFLNQQQQNSVAIVKATAFNSNTSLESYLVEWLPLDFGYGNNVYDFASGSSASLQGNAYWANPMFYAAKFNSSLTYTPVPGFSSSSYILANTSLSGTNFPFTIVAWVKIPYLTSGISWTEPFLGLNGYQGFGFLANGGGLVLHRCSSADVAVGLPGVTDFNTWHFVAVSVNYPNYYFMLDGNGVSTSNSNSYSSSRELSIGAQFQQCDGNPFVGQIADLQIYNTNLTSQQLLQLYHEGLDGSPLPTSHLVAWYPFDFNASNYASNIGNGTIYGPVSFVSANKSLSNEGSVSSLGGAYFSGYGSNITIHTSKPLLTGNQATLAVWIRWNGGKHESGSCCGTRQEILGADSSPGNEVNPIIAVNDSGTDEAETWVCTKNSCWPEARSLPNTIIPGEWYFLVSRYNGTALSLWINGKQEAVAGVTGNLTLMGNGNYTYIGSRSNTGSYFNGTIVNAQIYNTSLSASQIQDLYKEGISGMPVDFKNLVGWWPLDGNAQAYNFNMSSGMPTNVNYVGIASSKPSLFEPSLNGSGVNFNGQSGYIYLLPNALRNGVYCNLTIAAWSYDSGMPSSGAMGGVVGFWSSGSSSSGWDDIEYNDGTLRFELRNQSNGNAWFINQNFKRRWIFTALVLKNGVAQAGYINGVEYPENRYIGCIGDFGGGIVGSWDRRFNGTIADVQVYNAALSPQQIQSLYEQGVPPSANTSASLGWSP